MCEWVNDNWDQPAVRLCAYVMWRLNWIHPFTDGNGRTSRAVAYVVLCCRAGARLPGSRTIPEQIAGAKWPYYEALEKADEQPDTLEGLAALENMLTDYLRAQLESAFADATSAGTDKATAQVFH